MDTNDDGDEDGDENDNKKASRFSQRANNVLLYTSRKRCARRAGSKSLLRRGLL